MATILIIYLIASGNVKDTKEYIHKSLLLSIFLSAPIAFRITAVVNEFVPLFYGKGYDVCKLIIPILFMSSIFVA